MGFFILGSDIAYYTAVVDLAVLGDLVPVDEETRVCALDILYSFEYSSDLIDHDHCTFLFVCPLHRVTLLLVFSSLG